MRSYDSLLLQLVLLGVGSGWWGGGCVVGVGVDFGVVVAVDGGGVVVTMK